MSERLMDFILGVLLGTLIVVAGSITLAVWSSL